MWKIQKQVQPGLILLFISNILYGFGDIYSSKLIREDNGVIKVLTSLPLDLKVIILWGIALIVMINAVYTLKTKKLTLIAQLIEMIFLPYCSLFVFGYQEKDEASRSFYLLPLILCCLFTVAKLLTFNSVACFSHCRDLFKIKWELQIVYISKILICGCIPSFSSNPTITTYFLLPFQLFITFYKVNNFVYYSLDSEWVLFITEIWAWTEIVKVTLVNASVVGEEISHIGYGVIFFVAFMCLWPQKEFWTLFENLLVRKIKKAKMEEKVTLLIISWNQIIEKDSPSAISRKLSDQFNFVILKKITLYFEEKVQEVLASNQVTEIEKMHSFLNDDNNLYRIKTLIENACESEHCDSSLYHQINCLSKKKKTRLLWEMMKVKFQKKKFDDRKFFIEFLFFFTQISEKKQAPFNPLFEYYLKLYQQCLERKSIITHKLFEQCWKLLENEPELYYYIGNSENIGCWQIFEDFLEQYIENQQIFLKEAKKHIININEIREFYDRKHQLKKKLQEELEEVQIKNGKIPDLMRKKYLFMKHIENNTVAAEAWLLKEMSSKQENDQTIKISLEKQQYCEIIISQCLPTNSLIVFANTNAKKKLELPDCEIKCEEIIPVEWRKEHSEKWRDYLDEMGISISQLYPHDSKSSYVLTQKQRNILRAKNLQTLPYIDLTKEVLVYTSMKIKEDKTYKIKKASIFTMKLIEAEEKQKQFLERKRIEVFGANYLVKEIENQLEFNSKSFFHNPSLKSKKELSVSEEGAESFGIVKRNLGLTKTLKNEAEQKNGERDSSKRKRLEIFERKKLRDNRFEDKVSIFFKLAILIQFAFFILWFEIGTNYLSLQRKNNQILCFEIESYKQEIYRNGFGQILIILKEITNNNENLKAIMGQQLDEELMKINQNTKYLDKLKELIINPNLKELIFDVTIEGKNQNILVEALKRKNELKSVVRLLNKGQIFTENPLINKYFMEHTLDITELEQETLTGQILENYYTIQSNQFRRKEISFWGVIVFCFLLFLFLIFSYRNLINNFEEFMQKFKGFSETELSKIENNLNSIIKSPLSSRNKKHLDEEEKDAQNLEESMMSLTNNAGSQEKKIEGSFNNYWIFIIITSVIFFSLLPLQILYFSGSLNAETRLFEQQSRGIEEFSDLNLDYINMFKLLVTKHEYFFHLDEVMDDEIISREFEEIHEKNLQEMLQKIFIGSEVNDQIFKALINQEYKEEMNQLMSYYQQNYLIYRNPDNETNTELKRFELYRESFRVLRHTIQDYAQILQKKYSVMIESYEQNQLIWAICGFLFAWLFLTLSVEACRLRRKGRKVTVEALSMLPSDVALSCRQFEREVNILTYSNLHDDELQRNQIRLIQ